MHSATGPSPWPSPHRWGEGTKGRGDCTLLMLLCCGRTSPLSAPSTAKSERHGPAPVGAGRGRRPKRPSSGQGWPVDGPRSGCGAQGTRSSRFFFCDERAQTPGRRFLVTSFRCWKEVTRRRRKTSLSRSGGSGTRASARIRISEPSQPNAQGGQLPTCSSAAAAPAPPAQVPAPWCCRRRRSRPGRDLRAAGCRRRPAPGDAADRRCG